MKSAQIAREEIVALCDEEEVEESPTLFIRLHEQVGAFERW
jgi:hypothetical protein